MLLVATYVGPSSVHGMGLFACQDIKQGTLVYKPSPLLDVCLSEVELTKLSAAEQSTVRHYGFRNKSDGLWYLAFDDIRFCNHSTRNSNIGSTMIDGMVGVAAQRNIAAGEELLQNYQEFEELRSELRNRGI